MSISTQDDEVSRSLGRVRQDRTRDIDLSCHNSPNLGLEAVTREVLADVGPRHLTALDVLTLDDQHIDCCSANKKW
jgi:hypothetical protein